MLFEFSGGLRLCEESACQRSMRYALVRLGFPTAPALQCRRETWARTSFHGFAVDSPATTRRARASISLAQAACTAA